MLKTQSIKNAKDTIKNTVTAYLKQDEYGQYIIPVEKQRPVILIGPPGIGKTAIMEQVASEMGIGLVSYSMTHHTRQSAIGLPVITEKEYNGKTVKVSEYTMSEIIASIYNMIEETGVKNGILFLDEINCVSETLRPLMLKFLQYKEFGCHKIPEGWVVVAAGNPPEYNDSVHEFDVVTLDRMKPIYIEPNLDAWLDYANKKNVHPAISVFLNTKRDLFYKIKNTVDGKNFVTARSWEDLSTIMRIYESENINVDESLISQYIQYPGICNDFASFYDLFKKYQSDYQIESILKGQVSPIIMNRIQHADFDERYSVIGLLMDELKNAVSIVFNRKNRSEDFDKVLKSIKKDLQEEEEGDSISMKRLLENHIKELITEIDNGRASKSLDPDQITRKRAIVDYLSEIARSSDSKYTQVQNDVLTVNKRSKNNTLTTANFNLLSKKKSADDAEITKLIEKTKKIFTNVFNFMDEAFGPSNEMQIFMTDLTVHPLTSFFIVVYRVSEYFTHNNVMLIKERGIDLNQRLKELEEQEAQQMKNASI